MIDLKPPVEATVTPGVAKLLQKDYYVTFSPTFPSQTKQVSGLTFQISQVNVVPIDLHYILPGNDFSDVDLSNNAAGEDIYPDNERTLYEVLVGFKPGAYLVHLQIPSSQYVSRLEQASMNPDVTIARQRYIGAKKPSDSPYDDPRLFLYFVKYLDPLVMRVYIEPDVDYEKAIIGLTVNKCYLTQIPSTPEIMRVAKKIPYYTELRW
jgi:hypothetical protein